MNDDISPERIESDVRRLAATPRHGVENTAEHRAVADWIESELRSAGCSVESQEFAIPGQDVPRTGRNVVGLRKGTDHSGSAVLVGAHYDTVAGSPGADDNASGVTALLECARAIKGVTPRWPVVFAAFDAEEKQPPVEGLHGSTAFVETLASSPGDSVNAPKVAGAIILECIGYSSPAGTQRFPTGFQLLFPRAFDVALRSDFAGDSLALLSNSGSRSLARRFERVARSAGLPTLPVELPGWMRVPYNLRRSDHAPFWNAGIPAIMLGDTANFRNPNYHSPSDTPDTLDYEMIRNTVNTLVTFLT